MAFLWFDEGNDTYRYREPLPGEEGGMENPPKTWRRLIHGRTDKSETSPRDGRVSVYGSGDQTKSIYGEDGKPYRFTEGTKNGQMSELKHRMEERFVKNNKAAWPVKVDVSY